MWERRRGKQTRPLVEALTRAGTHANNTSCETKMPNPIVIPKGGAKAPAIRKKRVKLTPVKLLHLAHRLGILCMALQYAVLNFQASWYTFSLLTQKEIPTVTGTPTTMAGITAWVGSATIGESPLVRQALGDSTEPRNGTLYLHSSTNASFSSCESMTGQTQLIHEDAFQRSMFASLITGTSYGYESTAPVLELIVPIVDCSNWEVVLGVENRATFYFLVRFRTDPENPIMFVVPLLNQEYEMAELNARGPAAVATIGIVKDMQATELETRIYAISLGYPFEPLNFRLCMFNGTISLSNSWSLAMIPDVDESEIPKNVTTSALSGFYIGSRTEQSHIISELPLLDQNPQNVVSRSITLTKTLLRDSWAWVHFLQLFLGLELLINLVPLVVVSYRSFTAGKLWVGDAFVSISSTISARGIFIMASWYVSRFWTIRELCAHDAYAISNLSNLHIYEYIARADLLGLYLSVCGVLGMLTRERVDPFFACVCFHTGFDNRAKIINMFTTLVNWASSWAVADLIAGMAEPLEGQTDVSPMAFWTSHELENTPGRLYMTVLGPVCITLVLVMLQIIAAKVYRRIYPSKTRELLRSTDRSGQQKSSGGEAMLLYKRVLTLFEIATGAELENRFGLMSDYENYVFFKGMKFASADGVYSNGFVIVNDKFVIQSSAFFKILVMKLLRKRYTSIYVYEMAGTTVQQTARLVYPETMSFGDLMRLNIAILS
jgi:hypothetical protein